MDFDEFTANWTELTPEEFEDVNIPPESRRGGLCGTGAVFVVNDDGTSGFWARNSSTFTGALYLRRKRRATPNASPNSDANEITGQNHNGNNLHRLNREEDSKTRVFYDEFRVRKRLIHPGEVNRIRYIGMTFDPSKEKVPENHDGAVDKDVKPSRAHPTSTPYTVECSRWLVTHSDTGELLVWNVNEQVHRADNDKLRPSVPEMVLTGHTAQAPYAVDTIFGGDSYPNTFRVASGGEDCVVLVWNLTSELLQSTKRSKKMNVSDTMTDVSGSLHPATYVSRFCLNLAPSLRLEGHTAPVEDIFFHPGNPNVLASCGDDGNLFLWDTRAPKRPANGVRNAHTGDVNCLDWSRDRDAQYILTGGADSMVRLWDVRKVQEWTDCASVTRQSQTATPVFEFGTGGLHGGQVTCVQWNPTDPRYFLSASETEVIIWDTETMDVLFRHAGHKTRIQEAYWNPCTPWVVMTTSEAGEGEGDVTPSMMQMWRPIDLIHMHDAEVAAEFDVWQSALLQS